VTRRPIWRSVYATSSIDGHSRPPHHASIALANGYVERMIGSIRRACLDHLICATRAQLRRPVGAYFILRRYADISARRKTRPIGDPSNAVAHYWLRRARRFALSIQPV
jgi:hypothetical protein